MPVLPRVKTESSGVVFFGMGFLVLTGAKLRSAWEVGLHPSSFRSQMCTFGAACTRRMCFFAHHPSQLRVEAAQRYIEMEQQQFGISDLWCPSEGLAFFAIA